MKVSPPETLLEAIVTYLATHPTEFSWAKSVVLSLGSPHPADKAIVSSFFDC